MSTTTTQKYRFLNELKGHLGSVQVVKFSSCKSYILSGGKDKTIILFKPEDTKGLPIQSFKGHGSQDSHRLVSGGGDRSVFLWDILSHSVLKKFSGHSHKINCVDFNSDASIIASGSFDTTVRLWDVRSNSHLPIQILEEGKDSISSLKIKEHLILTGSTDHKVRLYDLRKGRLYTDTMPAPVTNVDFFNDSYCHLISTLDSTVRLLDAANGSLLNRFSGFTNRDFKLGLTSIDQQFVVCCGEDNKVLIFDAVEGDLIDTLSFHNKPVASVAAASDKLVTASYDGKLAVWTNLP